MTQAVNLPAAPAAPPEPPRRRAPQRLAALAVLPVFLNLRGKPALLAGGGEGGAWKAELLAAAGADVTILADDPCEEMEELLSRGAAAGTLRLERRRWSSVDLANKTIALLDTECEAEAASFLAVGRALGTTVNVIDKPEHCDVQFGSIVNRSPVVVGISTDGAAPILGQAVRQRVEAVLPGSIGRWGTLMRTARERLLRDMPDRETRRSFFRRLVDAAFRREPNGPADLDALAAEARANADPVGSVVLVGAGPGDAKYLTLEAIRALQSADVVLHDALISEEVLELARREARRVLVGKRASRASCRQDDINELLLEHARAGERVVRLKSGDPTVFGRAGEEIAACEAAGIPVEVVPGVTTAFALAARLGISLTHRDHARSLRFVTGHSRDGGLPADIDWPGLADGATTLVFYMGARVGGQIADRLIAHGLPAHTPAAAAASLSSSSETIWRGTLDRLEEGLECTGLDGPVIIAIGEALAERPATPAAIASTG